MAEAHLKSAFFVCFEGVVKQASINIYKELGNTVIRQ